MNGQLPPPPLVGKHEWRMGAISPLGSGATFFFFAMSILTTLALCSHFPGLGTGERKDGSGKKH